MKIGLALSIVVLICSCNSKTVKQEETTSQQNNVVKIVGAMRNVMHKGELYGTIDLDTIANKNHLYGMGPVEYLTGEIMIMDGICYKSVVVNDSAVVTETYKMKAPFFGYATIDSWKEIKIPDTLLTIPQLENFLNQTTEKKAQPFLFKLIATVDSANIHIVNLPEGTKVSSPEEAHQGQKNFYLKNTSVEMLGFFSTQHQAIFTHHDTWLHIHLITDDKQQMGHLETITIKKGTAKLYLPSTL
jgi:acetolactate decarboxylase